MMVENAQISDEPIRRSLGSSDEFDDDDFDTEMAEALDVQPPRTTSAPTIPTEPIQTLPQAQPSQIQLPAEAPSREADSDDEFGMDDEDEFAADLEHVVSLYDIRTDEASHDDNAPREVAENDATAVVIDLASDDSDEFGEDIDVDTFAAAEVAATQTQTNPVCRTRSYP